MTTSVEMLLHFYISILLMLIHIIFTHDKYFILWQQISHNNGHKIVHNNDHKINYNNGLRLGHKIAHNIRCNNGHNLLPFAFDQLLFFQHNDYYD